MRRDVGLFFVFLAPLPLLSAPGLSIIGTGPRRVRKGILRMLCHQYEGVVVVVAVASVVAVIVVKGVEVLVQCNIVCIFSLKDSKGIQKKKSFNIFQPRARDGAHLMARKNRDNYTTRMTNREGRTAGTSNKP